MTGIDWEQIFDCWGEKVVKPNDKIKEAYLPLAKQREAINQAGITPSKVRPGVPFEIITPLDPELRSITASFYYSTRSKDAKRRPEPRMGQQIISDWLEVNEPVLIGNIGKTLYAIKLDSVAGLTTEEVMQEIARRSPHSMVLALAKKAPAKPGKKMVQRSEFTRNPYVVAAAIHRAKEACEMPGCSATLFQRDDGSAYLEVHHIVPLSEKGADSLDNVAALCPHCHRKQHHSKDRTALRKKLKKHVRSLLA